MWRARRTERAQRRLLPAAAAAAAALLIGAVQLPGCAMLGRAATAPAAAPLSTAQLSQLLRGLADRARVLTSLQSAAVMDYTSPQHHVKAREEIVVRRPDSLRVEAMSPFGVALVVAARGKELEIFDPGKNTLLRGSATAGTLNRFANIPLEPAAAVNLLLGLVPESTALEAPSGSAALRNGMTVVTYAGSDGSALDLGFSAGRLAMVRARGADGQVGYVVRYSDYRDIGGVMFAYVVSADFPGSATRVSFHFERPIINGETPGSLFVLSPGPNTRQQLISRAGPQCAAPLRRAARG